MADADYIKSNRGNPDRAKKCRAGLPVFRFPFIPAATKFKEELWARY